MDNYAIYLVLLTATSLFHRFGHVAGSSAVKQIRGIPISKRSLYSPDRDFECLDGSLVIPFTYINDDYCDCSDGSDEPGTAACINGTFYCQNTGYRPRYIPSAWVNDGICDCCDTSDEYASGKECMNDCNELGKEAKLKQQKAIELAKEGNKIRLEMTVKGKKIKSDYQSQWAKLKADYNELESLKSEKELLKNQAEERETAALEKYKPAEPEQPPVDEEEEEIKESEAENYFKMLDSDSDGVVTIAELQTRSIFDRDRNGEITKEEAMYFLNNKEELTMEEFIKTGWPNIKPFLMLEQGLFMPAQEKEETETVEETTGSKTSESLEHSVDNEKEEDAYAEEEAHADEHEKEHDEPEVQYDEETQALIDEANSARENFKKVESAANELLFEIGKLEVKANRDYGSNDEFASLDGECFEYTDLEYIYSLCLFGKATQKSKSGGSDIHLGYWNDWAGPEDNKYSKMKYDKGLTCWNGPSRVTMVTLTCGRENKIVSVTEPNRCEYAMEFSTPAVCNPSVESSDVHDEL